MDKPEVVQRYEEQIQQSENIYLDPVEIEDIYRYYAEKEDAEALGGLLRVGQSLYPDEPIVRQLDAEYELNMGSPAKALEKIDLIFTEENPYICILRSAALARLNRMAEAMDMAEAARYDEHPDEYISYDLGVGFMNAEQYPTALHYFSLSREAHPEDVRTLSGILFCLTHTNKLEEAAELAEKILALDPYHYEAWMTKGNYLSKGEQWQEAIEAYDYAMAICPDECDPIVLKALCLNMQGKEDESDAMLQDAMEKAHGWQLATICYEKAKRQIRNGNHKQAIQLIWKGLSDSSTLVDSLTEAAHLFRLAKDTEDAITMLESITSADEENETALVDLAELYTESHAYSQACRIYERLVTIHPQAAYYALWGSALLSNQEYDHALVLFRKANELEEMWQTYVLMTVCSVELNHPLQTRQYLGLAYFANPDKSLKLLEQIIPDQIAELEASGAIQQVKDEFQQMLHEKKLQLLDKQPHQSPDEPQTPPTR